MVRFRQMVRAALLAAGMASAIIVTGVLSAGVADVAHAAVVSRIDVRGNARMDADTVKTYLTISPGQQFGQQDIDDSVKSLFATGLFTDVAIYRSGSVLVVEVDESGVVNEVFFEGNKRLKDEVLSSTVQTSPRSTYSEQRVSSDVQRILDAYSRVGREDATVTYEVVPLANNRVNVIYRVNEGDKTKIRRINFVGNSAFGERRLREVLSTKQTHLFSWLRNDDIYDPDRLRADEERLRQFYYNNGYADFQVISSDVTFDESGNQYQITITVDEGSRYRFGEIEIDSTITEIGTEGLYGLLETRSGDHYSSRDVEDSIVNLTEYFAELGYAFVKVTPRGNRDFSTNTIDVTYQIDEGPRVYIQRINIVGNDRTRDHVIRREFEMAEGDPLNQVMIQKTKRRLEALGFFERVDITTRPGDSPDRVIVNVRVIDKATGEFSIGGGYSTATGAIAEISFSERNFLGRGQYIKVSAGFGTEEQNYGLSFTEPYFLGYRVAAGFDIYSRYSEATDSRAYGVDSLGGTLRFSAPLTDEVRAQVFYTANSENLEINDSLLDPVGTQGDAASELSAALATDTDWLKSGFGYQLTYNDLDNTRQPTEGSYFQITQTAYGAGGDAQYLSTEGTAVGYMTLSEDLEIIGMLRARGGMNWAYGGYRARDNFYQGSRDIRGFDSYGFGPRDPVTGDALGGMYYWNATAELTFPMPYIPESAGIRGGVFADIGQLWGVDSDSKAAITAANPTASTEQIDDNSIRASVGASILWASPFGPLRFDYAFPLLQTDWDETREFSFGVSTSF